MKSNNPQWINKWANKKCSRPYPDFYIHGYGSDSEPMTSYWMASLLNPMGDQFKEGVAILDYGCGGARLFNFIAGYLKNFNYIGAEPRGSKELKIARAFFEDDPRALFITCESAIMSKVVLSCDVVILGSIFTHLLAEKCESILKSLWPVVDNGGMIIFSAFFKPEAEATRPGAHGFEDCYSVSFQRSDWIKDLEQKFSHKILRVDKFQDHHIFRIQ